MLAAATVLTVAEQLLTLVMTYVLAPALGIEVPLLHFCAAVAVAMLVSRLPIAIDGIGVYEGVLILLLGLTGVGPAETVALAIVGRALNIVAFLPGAIVLIALTNLRLAEGNYVKAGEPVLALVDEASFYIQAYFEETKLPRIRVGAPVDIWLMGGDQPLRGEVESISRGITDRNASPDGQLLADVEPTFNWVRLAQRIPVRIKLDELPEGLLLSAGMTASVRVAQ